MFDILESQIAIPFPGMDLPVQIYPLTDPIAALAIGFGAVTVCGLLLAGEALAGSQHGPEPMRHRGFSRARAALGFALRESLR